MLGVLYAHIRKVTTGVNFEDVLTRRDVVCERAYSVYMYPYGNLDRYKQPLVKLLRTVCYSPRSAILEPGAPHKVTVGDCYIAVTAVDAWW